MVRVGQTRFLLDRIEHLAQGFDHLLCRILKKANLTQVGGMQVERNVDIVDATFEFLVDPRVDRKDGEGTVDGKHRSSAPRFGPA